MIIQIGGQVGGKSAWVGRENVFRRLPRTSMLAGWRVGNPWRKVGGRSADKLPHARPARGGSLEAPPLPGRLSVCVKIVGGLAGRQMTWIGGTAA
jgi:hypothetical protein